MFLGTARYQRGRASNTAARVRSGRVWSAAGTGVGGAGGPDRCDAPLTWRLRDGNAPLLPLRDATRAAADDGRRRGISPRRPQDQALDRPGAGTARRIVRTYVAELQRCVVEMNSGVVDTLEGLRTELQRAPEGFGRYRRRSWAWAWLLRVRCRCRCPPRCRSPRPPRYRQMLADYQLLAREQLICGTQVHVGSRTATKRWPSANRVAPYLPTLLALSASSPFWSDGSDTGYSSVRTLVWQRWPTTGLAAPVRSAAEYDQLVADLVASGVITDTGMVYFDVRPASLGADP